MRVLVIGATGTIGRAIVEQLEGRHEVIAASHTKAPEHVDLADPSSVRGLFERLGPVDAVVCAAGAARWKPLAELTDDDFRFSLANKLMGQIDVVRAGMDVMRDGGSFTLTSGVLAHEPTPGSAAISVVNAGVEAFARAAALEAPRGIRVNVVSPGWVTTTLAAMGRDPSAGITPEDVARVYVESVLGGASGTVFPARR